MSQFASGIPPAEAGLLVKLKRTVRLFARSVVPPAGMALLVHALSSTIIGVTTVCSAAAAEEPERTQARSLGYAGIEAFAAKDFATANAKLEAAYRLVAVPTLGVWSARALVKLGKWVEAEERYRSVDELVVSASDSEVQRRAQEEAKREREALLLEMPSIRLRLRDARPGDVRVSIDGRPLESAQIERERWVNPGRHVLLGVRGPKTFELVFEVSARERKELELRFPSLPAAPESTPASRVAPDGGGAPDSALHGTLRDVGWIALGAGGASLLTGTLAYFVGRRHYTTLERQNWCANDGCDSSDIAAYNTWRAVNLSGLVGGAVLGAAGVGLLIATPRAGAADTRATLSVRLDARTLVVGGHF